MEPDNPQDGQQLDPVAMQREMSRVLDSDPTLLSDIDKTLGGPPQTTPPRPKQEAHGKLAQMWERYKAFRAENQQRSMTENAKAGFAAGSESGNALARGAVEAANQASDALVGTAVGISKKTGLYKAGRSPEEQKAFLDWWSKPTSQANELRFSEDTMNDWFGPSEGINKFVESASQFAVGMAASTKYLKYLGVAGKIAAIPKVGKILASVASGATTDATFFDPHQQRLSNSVQDGPSWIKNPLTAFLAAKPDDSEAEGRLKNALEGTMISSSIDGFLHGIRVLKLAASGDAKGAAKALKEAENVKPSATDAATIQQTPDGDFAVVANPESPEAVTKEFGLKPAELQSLQQIAKENGTSLRQAAIDAENVDAAMNPAKIHQTREETHAQMRASDQAATADIGKDMPVPADAPVFPNRADAENAAVTMNVAADNEARPRGELSPEDVDAWKQQVAADAGDTRSAEQVREDTGLNPNYIQSPDEVVSSIKALVDLMPEASEASRGRPRTHAEIIADADGIFKDMSGEEVVNNAARIFGTTDRLDSHIFAMRQYLQALGEQARKLSRLASANPDNALANDQLAAALDTMLEFHAHLTGTTANVARALNAHQIPVGEAVEQAAKKAPGALTDGEAAATAEAVGAEAPAVEGKATSKDITPGNADTPLGPAQTRSSNAGTSALEPNNSMGPHRAPAGRKATEGLTKAEIRALARSVFMADGNPAEILASLRAIRIPHDLASVAEDSRSMWRKVWDYANSARMEAMLSGPKTQVTNAVNNAIAAFQRPTEYWWAGAATSNPALKQMGADMLGGMWEDKREAWSAAKKAFLMGENVLDPGNSHTGSSLREWGESSWLSRIARAPSRMLMSSDEFFKQLNYRGNLRAQILRQAREEGVTDAGELAQRLKDDMVFAFHPEGGAVNPLALQYARIGTFTNELQYGLGQTIQNAAQKHPLVRFIVPFVRTPVNIFRYAWERTPVAARFNQIVQEDLAAGGERAAIARAKIQMGTALWGTGAMLVATGQMTGGGPQDPQLRSQWKEAGHQPYSIKIPGTDRWISYRRGDPTFTPFGLIADIGEMAGELHDEELQHSAAMVIATIMANLSSKTFMQGVTDFADAMSSGRYDVVESMLTASVGSFVPNVLRQANPDDTIRETRGIIEEMKSRIPGLSTTLEPRRNLFGEKVMLPPGAVNRAVNPFTVSGPVTDTNVADQLLLLGRAFEMPAEKRNNIDLTDRSLFVNDKNQSAYDRMLQLMGKPANGMPSLRSRMEKLVQSDVYKKASEGDQTIQRGGMKWQLAANIINAYQNYAWAQVMKEYPNLRTAMRQDVQMKAGSRKSGQAGVDAVRQKYSQMFVK